MDTSEGELRIPREVVVALAALAASLVAATLLTLGTLAIEQKMGHPVTGVRYLRVAISAAFGLVYVVGMAKGYGKFRWLFVFGLVFSVLLLAGTALAWLGSEGQTHTYMAFLLVTQTAAMLLRVLALVLLFGSVSNRWFDLKTAQRKGRPATVADTGVAG